MIRTKIFFLLLQIVVATMASAQKEGNIWLSGTFAGIDFNTGSPIPFTQPKYHDIWRTNASICDSDGNLLFFTNGFRIFNQDYNVLLNGDSLNIGDYFYWGYDELPVPDGAIILPFPNSKDKYFFIHVDLKDVYVPALGYYYLFSSNLYYDVIDMKLDSGRGGVDSNNKEILFFSDTLANCGIKAVKGSNGKDWWIICHEYDSDRYYSFYLDSIGIHGPFTQQIGDVYTTLNAYGIFGPMVFSNDGTVFIKNNSDSCSFELYQFDRCTGKLSNRQEIHVSDTLYYLTGLSISPNSRFVYESANYWKYLFQFDLEAPNIGDSKILIDKYDGTLNPFPTDFFNHALGPDGKIYICSYDYNRSLHVINNPNLQGLACNFIQNAFNLDPATEWGAGVPNLPNYKLGAINCDTFSSIEPKPAIHFGYDVYPNPCYSQTQLSITGISTSINYFLYNTFGQLIEQGKLFPINERVNHIFNFKNLSAGVYLLNCKTEKGDLQMKILVQHE